MRLPLVADRRRRRDLWPAFKGGEQRDFDTLEGGRCGGGVPIGRGDLRKSSSFAKLQIKSGERVSRGAGNEQVNTAAFPGRCRA